MWHHDGHVVSARAGTTEGQRAAATNAALISVGTHAHRNRRRRRRMEGIENGLSV